MSDLEARNRLYEQDLATEAAEDRGQFRVLSVLLSVPKEAHFTTADLVRWTGVSAEVIRMTYQHHSGLFSVVREVNPNQSGERLKVRKLAPTAKEYIMQELYEASGRPPGPAIPRGSGGEPASLLAAERILYKLVPLATRAQLEHFLLCARAHLNGAERECDLEDERGAPVTQPISQTYEARLQPLRLLYRSMRALQKADSDMDGENVQRELREILDLLKLQEPKEVVTLDEHTGEVQWRTYIETVKAAIQEQLDKLKAEREANPYGLFYESIKEA